MHYFIDTLGSQGIKAFKLPCETIKLYGYPQGVLREIFEILSDKAKEKNIKSDVVHCFVNNGIKAIIFPKLSRGVVNVESYEERGLFNSLENGYVQGLRELNEAERYFKEALEVHDEWEKYYIDNFDYSLLDEECNYVIKEIFKDEVQNRKAIVKEHFLGAATAFGPVDYIENITEDIKTRYFIKGRPGTGKSTFMRKILKKAIKSGFDAECYYCAFDPKSIDMVVIREKNVCIFDSTMPHEHFPSKEGDIILDFYGLAARRNVDREFKEELTLIAAKYKEKINMATDCIARYNNIVRQNEKALMSRVDKKNITCLGEVLAAEILGG